jgi:hypothetical protein
MKTTSFALMLFLAMSLPAEAAGVSGAGMSLAWGLPFAGLLLSIALMPLVAGAIWHHHYGKIAAGWTLLLVLPYVGIRFGERGRYRAPHLLLARLLFGLPRATVLLATLLVSSFRARSLVL